MKAGAYCDSAVRIYTEGTALPTKGTAEPTGETARVLNDLMGKQQECLMA